MNNVLLPETEFMLRMALRRFGFTVVGLGLSMVAVSHFAKVVVR